MSTLSLLLAQLPLLFGLSCTPRDGCAHLFLCVLSHFSYYVSIVTSCRTTTLSEQLQTQRALF